jgi:hypothetical protein
MDELPDRRVQAESMNVTATEGEDELNSRAVCNVSGANAVGTRAKNVGYGTIASRFPLVDAEDGSDAYVAINVAGAVKGIESNTELALLPWRDNDRLFVFLRNKNTADSGIDESVDHHVVRKYIELLLLVTGGVNFAGQTIELRYTGSLDCRCDELAGCGNGIQQDY